MNNIFNDRKKLISVVGYLIFAVPFLMKEKDDPAVGFHARQALGLFLAAMALSGTLILLASILGSFSIFLPTLIIVTVPRVLFFLGAMIGISNVVNGKIRPLPYIGHYIIKLLA